MIDVIHYNNNDYGVIILNSLNFHEVFCKNRRFHVHVIHKIMQNICIYVNIYYVVNELSL